MKIKNKLMIKKFTHIHCKHILELNFHFMFNIKNLWKSNLNSKIVLITRNNFLIV